jgi:hypothetical protein
MLDLSQAVTLASLPLIVVSINRTHTGSSDYYTEKCILLSDRSWKLWGGVGDVA